MGRLKIGDIFVYIFLVLLGLMGFVGMKSMTTEGDQQFLVIAVEGQEIERIKLTPDMEARKIRIENSSGDYNIVYISYDDIHVVEASCRDKLCIKQGSIKTSGQSIVCLPNKVVVKIIGMDMEPTVDDVTYLGEGLTI